MQSAIEQPLSAFIIHLLSVCVCVCEREVTDDV